MSEVTNPHPGAWDFSYEREKGKEESEKLLAELNENLEYYKGYIVRMNKLHGDLNDWVVPDKIDTYDKLLNVVKYPDLGLLGKIDTYEKERIENIRKKIEGWVEKVAKQITDSNLYKFHHYPDAAYDELTNAMKQFEQSKVELDQFWDSVVTGIDIVQDERKLLAQKAKFMEEMGIDPLKYFKLQKQKAEEEKRLAEEKAKELAEGKEETAEQPKEESKQEDFTVSR